MVSCHESKGLQAIVKIKGDVYDTHITYTDIKIQRSKDPKDTKILFRNPCRPMEYVRELIKISFLKYCVCRLAIHNVHRGLTL
jgi:hypothetical protein